MTTNHKRTMTTYPNPLERPKPQEVKAKCPECGEAFAHDGRVRRILCDRCRTRRKLTKSQREAMALVAEGADIQSPIIARELRAVQMSHPELIDICKPMGTYAATDRIPYFGAILTAEGRAVLESQASKNSGTCRKTTPTSS